MPSFLLDRLFDLCGLHIPFLLPINGRILSRWCLSYGRRRCGYPNSPGGFVGFPVPLGIGASFTVAVGCSVGITVTDGETEGTLVIDSVSVTTGDTSGVSFYFPFHCTDLL